MSDLMHGVAWKVQQLIHDCEKGIYGMFAKCTLVYTKRLQGFAACKGL